MAQVEPFSEFLDAHKNSHHYLCLYHLTRPQQCSRRWYDVIIRHHDTCHNMSIWHMSGITDTFTSLVKLLFPGRNNMWMGSLGSAGGVGVLIAGACTKFLVPKLGNRLAIVIGLSAGTVGIVLVPFVWNWWVSFWHVSLLDTLRLGVLTYLTGGYCTPPSWSDISPLWHVSTTLL